MTYYITREDGAKAETLDKAGVEAVVADGSDNERTISSIEEVNAHRDYEAWLGDGAQYESEDKREGVLYMIADSSMYEELEARVDALEELEDEALEKASTDLDAYVAQLDQKVNDFRDSHCKAPTCSCGAGSNYMNANLSVSTIASASSKTYSLSSSSNGTAYMRGTYSVRAVFSLQGTTTKYHNFTVAVTMRVSDRSNSSTWGSVSATIQVVNGEVVGSIPDFNINSPTTNAGLTLHVSMTVTGQV